MEEEAWIGRRLRMSQEAERDKDSKEVRWAVQEGGQKLAKKGMAVSGLCCENTFRKTSK
jgi:hypothetical protein